MARRVALFRAERRTEGVNAAERHCMSFNVKLTAYGKIGGFSEKVLRIVNLAVGRFRKIIGSSEVTRNISPAPSQSLDVIIGV